MAVLQQEGAVVSVARKVKQNAMYKWCISTVFILVAIGVGVWARYCLPCCLPPCPFVFAIESIMLLAFGISWVVKGDTLWSDEDEKNSSCCNDG